MTQRKQGQFKNDNLQKFWLLNATNLIEMKVKYSRFRHNAKQTSVTSPMGPRRQGGEHEHAQYPTNDDVTSGWSCRRPENVSILSSLISNDDDVYNYFNKMKDYIV